MPEIEIEIDGRKLKAEPNQMVIQVADEAGIYIPRFCYHKNLSIAANCRMCLIEVEKVGKPLPACATPVAAGMKVFTKSQKAIEAQRAVMEFLLINHPLDCPICDQGGECELQDLALGYGSSRSGFNECKRAVADEDIGPLVSTDMTRCIYCTRCVRFGSEIAGMRELGVTFRGEHAEISTYVKHAMQSEVSGNIIDLCPVGALTSKPYRFTARAWELMQTPSVGPHDCLGTNVNVHTLSGVVKRVVTRENESVNQCWIADRDRFSYEGIYHDDRVKEPMVRKNGKWHMVGWEEALEIAASGIQAVIEKKGTDQFGALATSSATVEELYLLQKITRALGSNNVDCRLRETDVRDQDHMPSFPGMDITLADFQNSDAVILIGSNLQKEQPLMALRLRQAVKNGAQVLAVNPVDYAFNFNVHEKIITAPQHMVRQLTDVVNALQQQQSDANGRAFAAKLAGKEKVSVIVGAFGMHHERAAEIRYLAGKIAELTNGALCLMTDGANTAGGWLAGAVPHRNIGGSKIEKPGKHAADMLKNKLQSYLLLNVEPELDCANAAHAVAAMRDAEFVVALSTYKNAVLDEHADVILPVAAFSETAGTYVNVTGHWQSFNGAASAFAGSRPAWKVLRVLGNFLHLDGYDYEDIEQVRKELKSQISVGVKATAKLPPVSTESMELSLIRIGEVSIYSCDALVRRSLPLQQAQTIMLGDVEAARIHPATAKKHHLQDGDQVNVQQEGGSASLSLVYDEKIAQDAVWVAAGVQSAAQLGSLFGKIDIQKA